MCVSACSLRTHKRLHEACCLMFDAVNVCSAALSAVLELALLTVPAQTRWCAVQCRAITVSRQRPFLCPRILRIHIKCTHRADALVLTLGTSITCEMSSQARCATRSLTVRRTPLMGSSRQPAWLTAWHGTVVRHLL